MRTLCRANSTIIIVLALFVAVHLHLTTSDKVHFKIYVPEKIHHDFHTKIIFVYPKKEEHHPKKEEKKEEQQQNNFSQLTHSENWNTWNYESKDNNEQKQKSPPTKQDYPRYEDVKVTEEYLSRGREKLMAEHQPKVFTSSEDDETDTYQPFEPAYGPIVMDEQPPHYDVTETVDETPIMNNDIDYNKNTYQKGYTRGSSMETGHNYSDEEKKYYDDKHVEDEEKSKESKDESHDSYQAYSGRYLVDEDQFLNKRSPNSNNNNNNNNNKDFKRRMFKTRRIRFYL